MIMLWNAADEYDRLAILAIGMKSCKRMERRLEYVIGKRPDLALNLASLHRNLRLVTDLDGTLTSSMNDQAMISVWQAMYIANRRAEELRHDLRLEVVNALLSFITDSRDIPEDQWETRIHEIP